MNTKGVKRSLENLPCSSHGLTVAGGKRFCSSAADKKTDKITYLKSLQEAKQVISQVMSKLHSSTHSNLTENFLEYIKTMISKLDATSKKKTTVGVFGRSGVGKSSLINTILGEQDLLPSGTITACTSVIIQVESNTTDSNYTAEIDFIPIEEWRKEVENYLISQGEENDDDNDEDKETMSTAKEKIQAVYGDIRSNATLEELMDKQNFKAIPEFLVSSKKIISCTSASELSEEIDHFTRSDSSSDPYFWPLVKAVTIKTPSGRGFDNIALIDLPGTGDFNKSRDEMWKTCLSRCSTVWIVNDINRAASDKEPWKILTSCIKDMTHGGECNSITFICTKSDNIDYREYMKSYKLKDEDLNVKATQDLKAYENQLKQACILHRNEKAKEKVRTVFSKQTEIQNNFICDKDFFQVFTVSSKVYQGKVTTSILNEEETEIPALWRLLDKLDNSLHETSAKDYIQGAHGILSLIQEASSISSKTLKVKRDVLKTLKQNLEEEMYFLKAYLIRQSDSLNSCLSEGVVESLRLSAKTADKHVIKTNMKDARGYHRTLKALCEDNGFRRTKNGMIIDLNVSLAIHMYKHVNEKFKKMFSVDDPEVRKKSDRSIRGMLHKFNIINTDMTELYKESPVSLNLLFIKTQQNKVISRIEDKVFQRKKRIYNSLYESILSAMLPVYPRAAEIHGKNSFTARQKLLTEHIEKAVTYMFGCAQTTMMELFQKLIEFIEGTLREELDDIVTHALAIKDGLPLPDITDELREIKALARDLEL